MKVCKVVFNSVSHDARVLKEAQAVKELGHDVVIIGIQDANNRRPIDILDNGVTILRVAWTSAAVRPIRWVYAVAAVALLVVALAAYSTAVTVANSWPTLIVALRDFMTLERVLALLAGAVSLLVAARLARKYLARRRLHRSTLKRESDELLKYEAELARYRQALEKSWGSTDPSRALADSSSKGFTKSTSFLSRFVPRPLMAGVAGALRPASLNKWKVVWAREAMVHDLLKVERPDVIHAHDVSALTVCAEYKRKYSCKLAFDAHEVYDHLAQAEDDMAKINGKVMRKYQSDVDLFVTINESIGAYYKTHYPKFPRALIVKNATLQAPVTPYDGRLHRAAGLPLERRILIYQGGYAPKRGLLQLLQSVEYLGDEWSLVFMGWGRLEAELRQTAESLLHRNPALADKIRFVPKVPQRELALWTNGAALGAIPYENAGLNHWFCTPNKLWEYPNAGVPIIASPFPELRRLIEANEIGWFLPDPLTPKEIAAAINSLTPEMLRAARERCLDFIATDNWSLYASRLKKAYGTFAQ